MPLIAWKSVHETISDLGAGCGALDAHLEHVFQEIDDLYARLADRNRELDERESELDRREHAIAECEVERLQLVEKLAEMTAELSDLRRQSTEAGRISELRDSFAATSSMPQFEDLSELSEVDPVVSSVMTQFAKLQRDVNERRKR